MPRQMDHATWDPHQLFLLPRYRAGQMVSMSADRA